MIHNDEKPDKDILHAPGSDPGRLKILIVDDRKENLFALRQVLSNVNAEVVEAATGNQALAATLDHNFALAILDVQMPGMDGYELAALLRGDPKTARLPVIFLTAAYGEEVQAFKGYEAGAVDYIVKPYVPAVLIAKVRVFLDLHRAQVDLGQRIIEISASEERYRSLVATIPDIVYRLDADGRFTFLNTAIHSLGYRPEELIGRPFSEIILPTEVEAVSSRYVLPKFKGRQTGDADAPKLFDERRRGSRQTRGLEVSLLSRKSDRAIQAVLYSGDPSVRLCEVNSSGLYSERFEDDDLVYLGAVGVIRDISERKRMEQELEHYREDLEGLVAERTEELAKTIEDLDKEGKAREKSERTLRAIFDNATDGILLADAETRCFVTANQTLCRMLGYCLEELKGLSVADIHPAEDLPQVADQFEKQLRGELVLAADCPVKRKDGRVFFADISAVPIELDGRTHLLGLFRDITERKQTEERIRDLAKFPSQNPSPVLRIARDGTLLYGNEASLRLLLDWRLKVGQTAPTILCEIVLQAMDVGVTRVLDIDTDGKVYSWYIAPFVDAGYANLYARDVTERKRAEEEIKSQLEELQRWQKVMLDREDRVQILKREVNELCRRFGEPIPYPSQEADPADSGEQKV